MAGWRQFLRRALGLARLSPRPDLIAVLVADNPALETIPDHKLIVVGGEGYQKWAYLRCPCGCGTPIMLSLAQTRRPRWRVQLDRQHRPTVRPSIWQTDGCCSHFWIRHGRVVWVGKGEPPTKRQRT